MPRIDNFHKFHLLSLEVELPKTGYQIDLGLAGGDFLVQARLRHVPMDGYHFLELRADNAAYRDRTRVFFSSCLKGFQNLEVTSFLQNHQRRLFQT